MIVITVHELETEVFLSNVIKDNFETAIFSELAHYVLLINPIISFRYTLFNSNNLFKNILFSLKFLNYRINGKLLLFQCVV